MVPVEIREMLERQDKVVKMEPEVLLDRWELLEQKVTVVTLDLLVPKDLLDEQALVEHKDPKETVELPVPQDHLVEMVLRAHLETSVNLVALV